MAIPAGNIRDLTLQEIRELMICPISYELLTDPVTEKEGVCNGHTFSREYIDAWLRHNDTCPIARTHLLARDLIPNHQIGQALLLLDPARVGPLDEYEMDSIYVGVQAFLQRRSPYEPPLRVGQEIHDDVTSRMKQAASDYAEAKAEKCKSYYQCSIQ